MVNTANESQSQKLPEHIVRLISVASQTDPRTVKRVVAGLPTKAMCRDRVLAAIQAHTQRNRTESSLDLPKTTTTTQIPGGEGTPD